MEIRTSRPTDQKLWGWVLENTNSPSELLGIIFYGAILSPVFSDAYIHT